MKGVKGFQKGDQGLNEAKSRGMIEQRKRLNLLYHARTLFENAGILPEIVEALKEEVVNGNIKNAIKFFDVIKESENNTTVNIGQSIQVSKGDISQAIKIINELR